MSETKRREKFLFIQGKVPLQHNISQKKKKKGLRQGLALDPLQGRLSRRGLRIFGALGKGNRLKGLNSDNRPFGVRNRTATYRPFSLLGPSRILTLIGPRRPRRTTPFSGHLGEIISWAALGLATSIPSGASGTSKLGVASSLIAEG